MSMILYHFQSCPYCAKVRNTVDEIGMTLELRDTRENDDYREELISLTGKTQVPCLVIDGEPMHESDHIIDYLKEKFGQ